MKKIFIFGTLSLATALAVQFYQFIPQKYKEFAPNPKHLVSDFYSFQSIAEVENIITKKRNLTFLPKKESNLSDGKTQPKMIVQSFTTENFHHLEISGKLIFVFLNDQLFHVAFYPKDFEEYRKRFFEEVKVDVISDELELDNGIKIVIFPDLDGHIIWVDQILSEQYELWIRNFSS